MHSFLPASPLGTDGSDGPIDVPLESISPVSPGDVIADKYRIDELLGFGGMGLVYRGYHLVLEQPIAVKFIRPELVQHPEVVERFMNEARAAACLKSHHIVHVLDVGKLPCSIPYIIMEHLEGVDLQSLLGQTGPLPIETAVDYVLEACDGLEEAHAAFIIHRDIKLENLFLAEMAGGRRIIKVLDFGIAKRITDPGIKVLTNAGDSVGSPLYMSPEQMSAPQTVDGRSDIWSLGVVLYQLLTGFPPFDGETVPEICARVLTSEPVAVRRHRPEIPIGLQQIVARCLEKEPRARFQTVVEFAAALAPYGSSVRPSARNLEEASGDAQRVHFDSAPPVFAPADVTDEDLRIPGIRPAAGWVACSAALALLALSAFGADRAKLIRVRDYTDGWLTPARLADAQPSDARPAAVVRPFFLMPKGIVAALGGDSDVEYLAAEREVEIVDIDEFAATVQARKARYRRYLDEGGLRPVDEVLRELESLEANNVE